MNRGIKLGRLFGIHIVADWSLLIIFTVVAFSLGGGVFRMWHPQWTTQTAWLTAFAAAVLFFVSILAHELAHALVGRRGGVRISRITLFVFGGMAHMEGEPRSWRVELWMTLAGPAMSAFIGLLCLWITGARIPVPADSTVDLQALIASIDPFTTILLWLGWVNIAVAIFNLIPGFPLDGGRVLRAAVWGATGDRHRATRIAVAGGQVVAWAFIIAGISMLFGARLPLLGGGFGNGLWIALIGWFLNNAAVASYRQSVLTDALDDVPVTRIARTDFKIAEPHISIAAFVDRVAMSSQQKSFPVVTDGDLRGMLSVQDVVGIDRSRWTSIEVRQPMVRFEKLHTVSPQTSAKDAAALISKYNVDELAVVEGQKLVGLVNQQDIDKWLTLQTPQSRTSHSDRLAHRS